MTEKMVDGHIGFLFLDKDGMVEVAMHWEQRFNHMVNRYNEIYKVQMPNITPHVCRHTYCNNMAQSGMNPKTLQYLMGCGCPVDTSAKQKHRPSREARNSDISVTMNVYTHLGLEDAADEMKRLEDLSKAREEMARMKGDKPASQVKFKAI